MKVKPEKNVFQRKEWKIFSFIFFNAKSFLDRYSNYTYTLNGISVSAVVVVVFKILKRKFKGVISSYIYKILLLSFKISIAYSAIYAFLCATAYSFVYFFLISSLSCLSLSCNIEWFMKLSQFFCHSW